MINTLRYVSKEHVIFAKFVATLILLWLSGALVGTVASSHISKEKHDTALVAMRTNVKIPPRLPAIPGIAPQADAPPSPTAAALASNGVALAVHSEKLDELSRQNQASVDDRKEMHKQMNELADRINVDEAQFKTIGWTFGTLFSLFSGVSTILAIAEFRHKMQQSKQQQTRMMVRE